MVARRAVAFLLSALCYSLFRMASASVPVNALPDSSGDAPLPATIPGAVAIVKRFQKKPLPAAIASTSDSPGQGSAEDPLHCTLNTFTSGTENPLVAATSAVLHDEMLAEPSSERPTPTRGKKVCTQLSRTRTCRGVMCIPMSCIRLSVALSALHCLTCRFHNPLHPPFLLCGGDHFLQRVLR